MPAPTLHVSNDQFIFMASEQVLKDDQVRPRVLLPLLSAFHRSLPLIAECGFPMIVDHVIERKDRMEQIAEALRGGEVFLIRMECPLDELERRETARGDRQPGLARMQLDWVHRHGDCDDEVNTFTHAVEQNVERLKRLFHSGRKPLALERIRNTRVQS